MVITAQQLADLLGGTIEGNPSVTVSRPGKIETGQEGEICFLGNIKYEEFAYTTSASILLVSNTFFPKKNIKPTLIRVENVYASLAFLLDKFGAQTQQEAIVSKMASIHPSVKLGQNVSIGDFTVIEEGAEIGDNVILSPQVFVGKNAKIGDNTLLHPGVKIYRDCEIGANCVFHAGVVIGSDGFGFAPQSDGIYKKITHTGNVVIEDDVELGSNTVVDRATIGSTIVRKGVKLDNLIQVAHNVEIGENTVIAALTGIGGSTKIGKNCRIGGQTGFAGHLRIGDNVQIQGQSGISNHQPDNAKLYGTPAFDYHSYLRAFSVFKKLPTLAKKVQELEKSIEKTEKTKKKKV
ncbi:MAG: UDP-3-O-(3-hydroxymyristoyl)glucosamine N-acyltransferase [Saprospiraceae bacterium]|nr:UDP-3-O-(3-hydroxymyristoyl)glucosamine N-acyltransferase [Saprospiraceae bacterium]